MDKPKVKRSQLFILVILYFFLFQPCMALEKVTIQLKWSHQFQFAGYYAAKKEGFYEDEGLDVRILPGGPGIYSTNMIMAGEADFGVVGPELILERLKGKRFVLLAVIFQNSPHTLMVDAKSKILTPADLVGKPIMINPPDNAEFLAMFTKEGISRDDLVIYNKDKTAMNQLITGRIAAFNGNIANQPFLLRQRHTPVRLIRPIEYGVNFLGDMLFTSERFLNKHPEQVAGFRRATIRGWKYALSNIDVTIDLILKDYNATKTRDHLKYEATLTRVHSNSVEFCKDIRGEILLNGLYV